MEKEKIKAEELYRYEKEFIHDDEGYTLDVKVVLVTYKVLSKTEKGYWIPKNTLGHLDKKYQRFVLSGSGKRYAHETQKEAMEYFIRRTKRHISYTKQSLRWAEKALKDFTELTLTPKE